MTLGEVGDTLAAVNASLNATSALALLVGWISIRSRNVHAHRAAMVTALTASALFLVFYVTRVALTGTHEFAGVGWARTAYFAILLTHTVLAAAVPFLAVATIYRGLRNDVARHVRLARITLPIWLYVSVTGVLVYVLLYHLYPAPIRP